MAEGKNNIVAPSQGEGNGYEMKLGLGTIAMLISATGMGLGAAVQPLGDTYRYVRRYEGSCRQRLYRRPDGVGRMGMGIIFFVILLFATHKVATFKKLKLTPQLRSAV